MLTIIKLKCGDDILASVSGESESDITVKNPIRVLLVPAPDGVGLSMMPWLIGAKGSNQEIRLNKSDVLASYEPDDELSNAYNQKFGGIVTARGVPSLKLKT
jgi:hypothetical protein